MGKILLLSKNLEPFEKVALSLGFETKVLSKIHGEELISDIQNFQPDYIAASLSVEKFRAEMQFLAAIKSIIPPAKIIVTGVPFLTYNTNAIYENQFIDYVISEEFERIFKELLERKPDKDILGLCYRENYQGVKVQGG